MELLIKILKEYNIELTDKQISQYAEYMEQILEYNEHINLTSITDRDEFIKSTMWTQFWARLTMNFRRER